MFIVPDPPLPSVLIGIYARVPLTVCQRIRNEERKRVKWRMFFIRSDFPFAPSAKQPKREHDFSPNFFVNFSPVSKVVTSFRPEESKMTCPRLHFCSLRRNTLQQQQQNKS
jgi:hypothetical protein